MTAGYDSSRYYDDCPDCEGTGRDGPYGDENCARCAGDGAIRNHRPLSAADRAEARSDFDGIDRPGDDR